MGSFPIGTTTITVPSGTRTVTEPVRYRPRAPGRASRRRHPPAGRGGPRFRVLTGVDSANQNPFLAAAGYIVAGPSFGNTSNIPQGAADVTAVITNMSGLTSGLLANHVDGTRVGNFGTSMGGMIGLSLLQNGSTRDARIKAMVVRAGMASVPGAERSPRPALPDARHRRHHDPDRVGSGCVRASPDTQGVHHAGRCGTRPERAGARCSRMGRSGSSRGSCSATRTASTG